MRLKHLHLLRSPRNGKLLNLVDQVMDGERVKFGKLTDGENEWPIVGYIPRFVPKFDYWDSFSLQWQRHPRIMNALFSGMTLYEDRFRKETRWGDDLQGQIILEAGCGVGSFTAPALATGATVISFDVSAGVETVYADNRQNENSLVVQASIYEMPFAQNFDKVFCFGVLQHCSPSAPLRQIEGLHEGRISGSS